MKYDHLTTPLVSVVLSVHNGERFLGEAVESILNQSFCDFEFIVVNDGSTDASTPILDVYQKRDSRIKVYPQVNRGLVESLNRGCALARGKYIARMDADDIAVRDRLMWQVDFMEKHLQVGVVGGAFEAINAAGELLFTWQNPTEDRDIKSALFEYCALLHPSVLMRKEAFFSVGGYRKVVVDAEDYDLWLRMADRFQLANLEAGVLRYRLHSSQVSVRKCKQEALSGLAARTAACWRRNGNPDPLESLGEITPATLASLGVSEAKQRSAVAMELLRCVRSMYKAGEYSVALDTVDKTLHSSDCKYAENWVAADLRLFAARLHWRSGRFLTGIFMVITAVLTRPKILGRPLKLWLRRIYVADLAPSPEQIKDVAALL